MDSPSHPADVSPPPVYSYGTLPAPSPSPSNLQHNSNPKPKTSEYSRIIYRHHKPQPLSAVRRTIIIVIAALALVFVGLIFSDVVLGWRFPGLF